MRMTIMVSVFRSTTRRRITLSLIENNDCKQDLLIRKFQSFCRQAVRSKYRNKQVSCGWQDDFTIENERRLILGLNSGKRAIAASVPREKLTSRLKSGCNSFPTDLDAGRTHAIGPFPCRSDRGDRKQDVGSAGSSHSHRRSGRDSQKDPRLGAVQASLASAAKA